MTDKRVVFIAALPVKVRRDLTREDMKKVCAELRADIARVRARPT